LASLAFRQAFAANELALHEGEVFYFSKSMDLSGASAIQSLDVMYPASTALLAFNPKLLQMQLAPILLAMRRGDWREAHAMSDLGAYPIATGQLATGASRAHATAELLLLARMAGMDGVQAELAPFVRTLSESEPTVRSALALGPSSVPRLQKAFEGSREQVFADLFVERFLMLGMVPAEVEKRALASFRSGTAKLGVPFEAGKSIVRVDALLWYVAAFGETPEPAAARVLKFYSDTPIRVPAADRYDLDTGRPAGTQGRPVLGAVFAPLLILRTVK